MTISTLTRKSGPYTGDGVTVSFAIGFAFFSNDTYIRVTKKTIATDSDHGTVLTNPTHYSVSGANVILVTAPTALEEILIELVLPQTQLYDYIAGGTFPQEDHETNLDMLIRIVQQLSAQIGRAPKVSIFSTYTELKIPTPVANYVLSWKSDLSGLENVVTTDEIMAAQGYAASALSSKNSASAAATTAASSATDSAASAAAAAASAVAAAASAVAAAAAASAATGIEEQGAVVPVGSVITLPRTPIADASVKLYCDGLRLRQGTEYTLAGAVATLADVPESGQTYDYELRY